jgi:hypothetical protein
MKLMLWIGSLCSVAIASAAVVQGNITAQELNHDSSAYLGKQITLTGRVDRVLGNGSYIVSDGKSTKDPSHRVLIFTSTTKNQAGIENSKNNTDSSRQQAGVAAITFKEGDQVRLNGKVEQFNINSEVDSFSPKTDIETIDQSASATPVVVIQPGSMTRY